MTDSEENKKADKIGTFMLAGLVVYVVGASIVADEHVTVVDVVGGIVVGLALVGLILLTMRFRAGRLLEPPEPRPKPHRRAKSESEGLVVSTLTFLARFVLHMLEDYIVAFLFFSVVATFVLDDVYSASGAPPGFWYWLIVGTGFVVMGTIGWIVVRDWYRFLRPEPAAPRRRRRRRRGERSPVLDQQTMRADPLHANIRCFLGLPIPETLREEFRRLQAVDATRQDQLRGVRWEQPGNLHVTLVFLGERDEEAVSNLAVALRTAELPGCFELQLNSLGSFPGGGKSPRVLWAGVDGDLPKLMSLQRVASDAAVSTLAYEPESRPYKPHVTLGRVKGAAHPQLLDAFEAQVSSLSSTPTWCVDHLCVFEVEHGTAGPEYRVNTRIMLPDDRR